MTRRRLLIPLLSLIFIAGIPVRAWAETVLEKIERTGVIQAGARKDAIPFSYVDRQDRWMGYSVDLMKLIHERLEEKLKKPLKLNLIATTVENRFQQVREGQIDLSCEAATITQERLQYVDFSIPYFMTGAQFLVKLSEIQDFNVNGTLVDVPIAYIPNTTTDYIIRQIYPNANWQSIQNRREGIDRLREGEVKAVASDGILLIGELVAAGSDPRQFALTPRQPLTAELYGCMVPKNNPDWKEIVDGTIVSEANRKLQERWFNVERGTFPYNQVLP